MSTTKYDSRVTAEPLGDGRYEVVGHQGLTGFTVTLDASGEAQACALAWPHIFGFLVQRHQAM